MATKNVSLAQLDWDDLRVFLTVARTKSLSNAARQLSLDHSTVSRRMAQLEATVGTSLFHRHRLGLQLNETGQALLPHVEKMEVGSLALKEVVAGDESAVVGRVRVASQMGLSSLYLASRLNAFNELCPGVDLELTASTQQVDVARRETDVLLGLVEPQTRGLASERIGEFSLVLCAGEKYAIRHGLPKTVQDLARHKFITFIDECVHGSPMQWLHEIVEEPTIALKSNCVIAHMHAAAAGLGLALLPSYCLGHAHSLVPVLEHVIDIRRPVWASVHRELQFFPRIKAVVSFLTSSFMRDQPSLVRTSRQLAHAA